MEQLILPLLEASSQRFENFLIGANHELVARLKNWPQHPDTDNSIYLWGGRGVGCSHLLHATIAAFRHAGYSGEYLHGDRLNLRDGTTRLVAIDEVELCLSSAEQELFRFLVAHRASGGLFLFAGHKPVLQLNLREDIRNRLGWGLCYEVQALSEQMRLQALFAYAAARGFRLSETVLHYASTHYRRDLASLLALLETLDRYSLAQKREITVPLLREYLAKLPLKDKL